jgi:hypothetical protein
VVSPVEIGGVGFAGGLVGLCLRRGTRLRGPDVFVAKVLMWSGAVLCGAVPLGRIISAAIVGTWTSYGEAGISFAQGRGKTWLDWPGMVDPRDCLRQLLLPDGLL